MATTPFDPLESISPELQKKLDSTPEDNPLWQPTTRKEIRAVELGLVEFAPRLALCGSRVRWGCHKDKETGRWHRHSQNRSRCMGLFACISCLGAYTTRIAAKWWDNLLGKFSPRVVGWRMDFKIPCKLGPTKEFTLEKLPDIQERIRKVKYRLARVVRKVEVDLGISWIWNYEDKGFLCFSIVALGKEGFDAPMFKELSDEFPGIKATSNFRRDPRAVSSTDCRKFGYGQLPVVLEAVLRQYPNAIKKGVRSIELQAAFRGIQRIDTWGLYGNPKESASEELAAGEEPSEVCITPDNTNFEPPSGSPMKCWCGEICTHVIDGDHNEPTLEELLRFPVSPPGLEQTQEFG